jgi:hypothetical protein
MTATACQTDPALFDVDRRMTRVDIDYALAACHTCPALAPCVAYLADCDTAGIKVHGIIAGQFRPWPKTEPKRPRGRPLSPCGTVAAYYRHVKRREPIDADCRTAAQQANARWKRRDRQQVAS